MLDHTASVTPKVEMLIMRYVREKEVDRLLSTLNNWEVKCCSKETGKIVDLLDGGSSSEVATSLIGNLAPVRLWDYPAYDVIGVDSPINLIETHMFAFARNKDSVERAMTTLVDISIVRIRNANLPEHYPFPFTFTYRFALKKVATPLTKTNLLHTLTLATAEIKELTDTVSHTAEYRPVYWFLNGFSEELVGLRGLPEEVCLPNGKVRSSGNHIRIERGFPYASYILYNLAPDDDDIRTTDLSLLSVIAHITERGYRKELHDLLQEVVDEVKQFNERYRDDENTHATPTIGELSNRITELSQIQTKIYECLVRFFDVRRCLVRSKGLVQRIRQIGGSDEKDQRTFLDVVCDDAITLIEDEASLSEDEVATSFKTVSDRLVTLNNQLNSAYNQRSAARGQELQTIGMLLQATAVGWIAFQMADKLLPQKIWDSLDWRAAAQVSISILFFMVTLLILWKWVRSKDTNSRQRTT